MNPSIHPNEMSLKAIPDESITKPHEEPIISWEAPEYVRHEKGKTWFLIAAMIVIGIVLLGLLTNSWTLSIVALVLAGVYYMFHQIEPQIITVSITSLGIKIGTVMYPYSLIKYFWIVYSHHVRTLHLKMASGMISELEIQLNTQNPSEVRNFLLQQIPEMEGKEESFTSIFSRLLKF